MIGHMGNYMEDFHTTKQERVLLSPGVLVCFFSSGLGFIPSFFLIQLVTLVTVKLIVHIAYLIMCSKTYKVKNVLCIIDLYK